MVRIKRSESMIVRTSVQINCSEVKQTEFEWIVRNSTHIVKIITGTAEWTVERRSLPYGILFVTFRVSLVGFPFANSLDAGFLRVVHTPLVVAISGGSMATRGFGKIITLDASPTEDPDVGPGDYSGMRFTWLCKKENETFPVYTNPAKAPIIRLPLPNTAPNSGGCFGTGIGRLEPKTLKVSLDTTYMKLNGFFTVKLYVDKETRNGTFEQTMKIVQGAPPTLQIK